ESPSELHSPEKYRHVRKRGESLNSTEQRMALNIYGGLRKMFPEWSRHRCLIAAGTLSGSSETTVKKLKRHHEPGVKPITPGKHRPVPDHRKRESVYGSWVYTAIRAKVHNLYRAKIPPTSKRVLAVVKEDPQLPSSFTLRTMQRILRDIGFKYMKRSRKSILLEQEELVVWRRDYLIKMKRFREQKRHIVYLDESYVNQRYTTSHAWYDTGIKSYRDVYREGLTAGPKTPTGKGGRFVLLHAGGEFGFVNNAKLVFTATKSKSVAGGTHHDEMCAARFTKWFKDQLLPNIPPNSIIVLDNASYHSVLQDRAPTMNDKRTAMIAYMDAHNIPYEEKQTKAELIVSIKARGIQKRYVVDELAKELGHTVLRLPPYHCELNPIELIWGSLKGYVALNNTEFTMSAVEKLIHRAFESITPELWKSCVQHVIKREQEMIEIDHISDQFFDNPSQFLINLEDSDSDEVRYQPRKLVASRLQLFQTLFNPGRR
ncbi:Protein FAM243A, partial [Frankliniella fusca]